MARDKKPIALVIDNETTGLTLPSLADPERQPRIIELAAVRVEMGGKIVSKHSWFIDPERPIPPEVTKITGITGEMLKGAPTFAKALPEIETAFRGASYLFAHNAPFDVSCIQYELRRIGKGTTFPWPEETVCTVQEYVHEFGHRPKLTELYERKIGKPLDQKHRALDDVLALVEILKKENVL